MKREKNADGSETITKSVTVTETVKRKTYPQQWKEYNQAQTNEKDHFQALLRSMCDTVKTPVSDKPVMGRPRLPMSDCVFMTAFKVYSTVSQRRFMCDLDDATEKGYLEKTPHFNAVSKALENEELTPVLERLIALASLPLKAVETDFAIVSTGFTTSNFYRWFDHKCGKTGIG